MGHNRMKRRIGRPFRASGVTVYRAGAVRDATGINHRPGAIAVRNGRIIAVGDSNSVLAKVKPLQIIDLHDSLILPAFVNAHTHLALTNLGSRSYNGHFVEWLEMIVREAPRDEAQITDAVHHGAELCWAAGVGMVGDIAPNPTAIRARMDSGLPGVSYLEWFGIGAREAEQA